ncbi:MAG: efflux RND transporter permease subunit [Ruminococcaceae bacterium]|nr:efflux RND transporter permease subunit [Oscillospiraceae bacterium]
MKLHELSVKRPVAVVMAVLVFVVIGLYSLSMLKMALMPDMEMSMALVVTQYPNVGPEEVENLVTKNVESAISSVSGVDTISSQTSEGVSLVMVQFTNGTDMDEAVSDMEDRLDIYEAFLPAEAEDPMVMKMDTSAMAAAMMSISYEGYDLVQTRQYIEDNLENKLQSVDGVASVTVMGAPERQIEVVVDPQKLFGYRMSLGNVVASIAAQNQNLPAGNVIGGGKEMSVRTMGKLQNVKDIEMIPLTTTTGQVIYLRDIASVQDDYSDTASAARLNGENSISVSISAESDANMVELVNGIIDTLDKAVAQNPKLSYNMTMEQGSYIEESISSVAENAIVGAILAILILLLFLGSMRTSLIIGISMPISVITTFIGMFFSGMSLNVVSLGGLALGVGMLVDNSVVVLENVFRRRTVHGEDAKTAAIRGTGEMFPPVVASVLTTCIVYVPILFIDNMMSVMFKQLAFAIIFSQIASLLTTFLLIPMLSARVKNVEEQNQKLQFILKPFSRMMEYLYQKYEIALRYVLKKRKRFMLCVMGVFVLCIVILFNIGMTLIPSSDEGTISVTIELPKGSQFEETDALTRQIEEVISQNENVETVFSQIGSDTMSMITGSTSSNSSSITVTLKDKRRKSTNEVVNDLRAELSQISGAELSLESSNSMMGMSSDAVSFNFSATDEDALEEYVLAAEKILAGIDGVTETSTSLSDTQSEVRLYVDKNRAAMYGFTTAAINQAVHQVLSGTTASRFEDAGSEYDIVVLYPEDYAETVNELKALQIQAPTGRWVAVSDVADVVVEPGYATLTRVGQKRTISLSAMLYDTDMGTVTAKFNQELSRIPKPEGVMQESGGTYEIMIDAMKSLLLAIFLGILLMYMVMAAQFENVVQPLIILFTIPLAMIGVVLSLLIARMPLSVVSCIGILMLGGIIVNNAIVLIDFINIARKEKTEESRENILVHSGLARMRPILMTTLTSVLGFLPMALASGGGSAMMQPLAVVLLGGLSVGTFLTLFVIPVMYSWVDDKIKKHRRHK